MNNIAKNGAKNNNFLQLPKIWDASVKLKERCTLGAIIYRNRIMGANANWLSKYTGFDKRTVDKHLIRLQSKGFIHNNEREWFATIPDGELRNKYRWKENLKTCWRDSIQTIKVPLPLDDNLLQVVILEIYATSKKDFSIRGLAKLLGVNYRSVYNALEALDDAGNIDVYPRETNGKTLGIKVKVLPRQVTYLEHNISHPVILTPKFEMTLAKVEPAMSIAEPNLSWLDNLDDESY